MIKINILKVLYKHSPMNFYTIENNTTIIKSTNNTSLGYKFDKIFTPEEISFVWNEIKLHKRWSTVFIFLFFVALLYLIIFPNFTIFVNNMWYYNAALILALVFVVYNIITTICTKIFEKRISKRFGNFSKTKFKQSKELDLKYYKLFKIELTKAMFAILVLVGVFSLVTPFELTKKMLNQYRYNEVIKVTSIGSKVFPIAQEWYSLRGYAKFQIGDYEGAIKDFDKAYRLGADGFNIMNFDNKIYIKYYLKEYDSALKDFDNEIKNADNENERDQFQWDKAQFLYNIKHYNEALSLYNDLIVKAENDRIFLLKDRLYLERAEVYKKLGQTALAQNDIENAGGWDSETSQNPIPKPVLLLEEEQGF